MGKRYFILLFLVLCLGCASYLPQKEVNLPQKKEKEVKGTVVALQKETSQQKVQQEKKQAVLMKKTLQGENNIIQKQMVQEIQALKENEKPFFYRRRNKLN